MVSHAKGYAKGQFALCLFNTYLYTVILALKKSVEEDFMERYASHLYKLRRSFRDSPDQ